MDALHSKKDCPFPESHPGGERHLLGDDHPARFYRNLTSNGGLVDDDGQWASIEKPDETGFCGMTTHAILRPSRILHQFENGGWKSQVKMNQYVLQEGADVVAFDNMPKDDHGYHHGISVSDVGTSVAYPPYTLVRLIEVFKAGEWTAPVECLRWKNVGKTPPDRGREISCRKLEGALRTKSASAAQNELVMFSGEELKQLSTVRVGQFVSALHHHDYINVDASYWQPDVEMIRPNCRLLLVRATFKFPEPQCSSMRAAHKMCDESTSLYYGARQTYIDGLNDILHKPIERENHRFA
jgi:hypothetical protein